MTRRVLIACIGYGHSGARYRVTDEGGRMLVASSRDPEFDAARVLLAEGVTGRLEVWRATGTEAAMYLDIEKAAELMVEESATASPRIRSWKSRNAEMLPNCAPASPNAVSRWEGEPTAGGKNF
jgi:hypothetical protein